MKFSQDSLIHLEYCDDKIKRIANEAIKFVDFSVVCGYRDKDEQTTAYNEGHSKTPWPQSLHNSLPSQAVDVQPYPWDGQNLKGFYFLAGVFLTIAYNFNIPLRWGGDWDNDKNFENNKFNDLFHFELIQADKIKKP